MLLNILENGRNDNAGMGEMAWICGGVFMWRDVSWMIYCLERLPRSWILIWCSFIFLQTNTHEECKVFRLEFLTYPLELQDIVSFGGLHNFPPFFSYPSCIAKISLYINLNKGNTAYHDKGSLFISEIMQIWSYAIKRFRQRILQSGCSWYKGMKKSDRCRCVKPNILTRWGTVG